MAPPNPTKTSILRKLKTSLIGESLKSSIASLQGSEREEALARLLRNKKSKRKWLKSPWTTAARPEQAPPLDNEWLVWLLLAGRGFGKTRTGAETVRLQIEEKKSRRIALVAPTAADVRDVMVGGPSGILAVFPDDKKPIYEPSRRRILFSNGAVAMCYSAEQPNRLRGPQHDFAWLDELAAYRYPQETWDMLMLGLRLGDWPRVVVTTTPKPIQLIRDLVAAPTTRVTRGSTRANKENLAPGFFSAIIGKYEGTRLGRQEIDAELLEQAEGALWARAMLEAARIAPSEIPEMKRVVVAIDPAVTARAGSDETGIVVAGLGVDGLVYVMRDASGRFTPAEWARRAIHLYDEHAADRIVGETNNGGDLIVFTLRTVREGVSYKSVTARHGKRLRAEPVAALYEQGRVRHAGGFPLLEDQMCNWVACGHAPSPDRLDALVWAVTELALAEQDTGLIDWTREEAAAIEKAKQAGK